MSYKNQPTGHILLHSLILLTESAISRQVFLPRYSTKFSFSFGFQCSSGNLFSNVETVHLAELHHRPNHTAIISTPSPPPGSLKKVFHVCLPTACLSLDLIIVRGRCISGHVVQKRHWKMRWPRRPGKTPCIYATWKKYCKIPKISPSMFKPLQI